MTVSREHLVAVAAELRIAFRRVLPHDGRRAAAGEEQGAMNDNRRRGDFVERFSLLILFGSFLGGFLVLIDPRLTIPISAATLQIGGNGFSADLRGAVVQSMLIAGLSAAVGYWLGQSKTRQDTSASVQRIAEAAPTVVAAAAPESTKVDAMNVDATGGKVSVDGRARGQSLGCCLRARATSSRSFGAGSALALAMAPHCGVESVLWSRENPLRRNTLERPLSNACRCGVKSTILHTGAARSS